MEKNQTDLKPIGEGNSSQPQQNQEEPFLKISSVKKCKNHVLKNTLQTLIKRLGKSEADFYKEQGFSKQYWYGISWGLLKTPLDVKIKISLALGTDSSLIWQNKKEEKNG